MVKIWSVTLRKSYNLGDVLAKRTFEVVAENPTEAIKKARNLQKKRARAFLDHGCCRFATSVVLTVTEST